MVLLSMVARLNITPFIRRLWYNFLYSGFSQGTSRIYFQQIFFTNIFSFLAFLSMIIFGLDNMIQKEYFIGTIELLDACLVLVNIIVLRTNKNIQFAKSILLFSIYIILLILLVYGGIENTGIFWFFTFPAAAFFLEGISYGILWIILLYISSSIILILQQVGLLETAYSLITFRQLFISLLVTSIAIYLYELTRQLNEDDLAKKQKQLGRDIVERIHIEDDLVRSRKDLQDFLDSLSTLSAKVAPDGSFVLVNQIAQQGLGLSRDQLNHIKFLEGPWWSFDHSVQKRVKEKFAQALHGETIKYEEKIFAFKKELTIDFSLIPIKDTSGNVIHIIAEGRDISALKVVEEHLQKSKEALQKEKRQLQEVKQKDEAILENIGEGIIATDDKGITLYINKAAEEMLGWKNEEIVGKQYITMVHMLDKNKHIIPEEKRPVHQLLQGRKMVLNDCYYVRRNETSFPVSFVGTPIRAADKVIGMVVVFRDITEEKEVDRAKTEFVTLASHQLRTPISAISWFTEMLLAGDTGPLNEEQKEQLEQIYKSNQRMAALVNALLNVSRLELGQFPVSPQLANLIELSHTILLKELKDLGNSKELIVNEFYEPALPLLQLDINITRLILQNLFSNAIKYTPKKGTITIRIEKKDPDVLIMVQDTGYGIPKYQQGKIFTKLFRADNIKAIDTDGTGLGLYIVKSTLDAIGGRITVHSEETKGTTFYVTIPLSGMKTQEGTKGLITEQEK